MIGVDLAKTVFQLHGASMTGELKFRKKLSRGSFARFMAEQPPAVIVMEACGSAHYWAREMRGMIALANKMARMIWVVLTKNEDYRVPTRAAVA
ncbi:hypothetical protein [Rhizobium tubonense]|uniref:hypothetical protein n=1 Tax=Rhizobium tubonense TaxID=484088 RepID=UPI001FCE8654|nr:hypothetical protein [Rhizobium tubonense]